MHKLRLYHVSFVLFPNIVFLPLIPSKSCLCSLVPVNKYLCPLFHQTPGSQIRKQLLFWGTRFILFQGSRESSYPHTTTRPCDHRLAYIQADPSLPMKYVGHPIMRRSSFSEDLYKSPQYMVTIMAIIIWLSLALHKQNHIHFN